MKIIYLRLSFFINNKPVFLSKFKKIIILLSICISFITVPAFSESVYDLDLKTEVILAAVAASLFAPNLFVDAETGSTKSKDDINFLDKQFIYPYNKTLDTVSTVAAGAALALPVFSVLENIKDLKFLGTYVVMYAEAFLLTMTTKDLFKLAVSRNRPYTYEGDIPSGQEDDYYNSFPSGHTAFAFLGATFLATTFSAEYPDSKWKIPLIIGGYSIAASVGVLRVASGNHFVTDVLAGALIGTFYGWFIPKLHLRTKNNESEVIVTPTGNSLLFSISY